MGFAEVFSELRRENGFSQRKVANDLNISQALLSHYENGIREPRLDFIVKACNYYGVTADYMLGINRVKNNPYSTGRGEKTQWEKDSLQSVMHTMSLVMNLSQEIGGEPASRMAENYLAAAAAGLLENIAAAAGERTDISECLMNEAALHLMQLKHREALLAESKINNISAENLEKIVRFSAQLKLQTQAALEAK